MKSCNHGGDAMAGRIASHQEEDYSPVGSDFVALHSGANRPDHHALAATKAEFQRRLKTGSENLPNALRPLVFEALAHGIRRGHLPLNSQRTPTRRSGYEEHQEQPTWRVGDENDSTERLCRTNHQISYVQRQLSPIEL